MPKPYPKEFRENVVAVARQGEEGIATAARASTARATLASSGSSRAASSTIRAPVA